MLNKAVNAKLSHIRIFLSILALAASGIVGLIGAIITFYTINGPFDKMLNPSNSLSEIKTFQTLMVYILIPRFISACIFALILSLMLIVVFKYVLLRKLPKVIFLFIFAVLAFSFLFLIFPKKVLKVQRVHEPPNVISRIYHYNVGSGCFDVCDSAYVTFFTGSNTEELISFYQREIGPLQGIYKPFPETTSFYIDNNRLGAQIRESKEGVSISFTVN